MPKRTFVTFWTWSERLVPCVVRMLARKKWGRPLTDQEIADASGLSAGHVMLISQQTDWTGIDLPTMRKFLAGCGLDFFNQKQMKRVDSYLRMKPTWAFLKHSEQWESLFLPLILKWQKAKGVGISETPNTEHRTSNIEV